MLSYDRLSLGAGGPWELSLALPGLPAGPAFPKEDLLPRIARQDGQVNIALTGGEPLSHPDILEIVSLCRKAGYKRILARTGGARLLEDDFLLALLRAGVNLFEVLLPGSGALAAVRNLRRVADRHDLPRSYAAVAVPVCGGGQGSLAGRLAAALEAAEADRVVFCWGEPGFPVWRARRELERALALCDEHRVWAALRGIPACAVAGRLMQHEELFGPDQGGAALPLPEPCRGCCLRELCARMPASGAAYAWEPEPALDHPDAPFINDLLAKGHVFDGSNERLYSSP